MVIVVIRKVEARVRMVVRVVMVGLVMVMTMTMMVMVMKKRKTRRCLEIDDVKYSTRTHMEEADAATSSHQYQ